MIINNNNNNDNNNRAVPQGKAMTPEQAQDSSKGGAVETGCSDLYDVIYWLIICYPHPLHPPPTAPPCNEYPCWSTRRGRCKRHDSRAPA